MSDPYLFLFMTSCPKKLFINKFCFGKRDGNQLEQENEIIAFCIWLETQQLNVSKIVIGQISHRSYWNYWKYNLFCDKLVPETSSFAFEYFIEITSKHCLVKGLHHLKFSFLSFINIIICFVISIFRYWLKIKPR